MMPAGQGRPTFCEHSVPFSRICFQCHPGGELGGVKEAPRPTTDGTLCLGGEMGSQTISVTRSSTGHVVFGIAAPGTRLEDLFAWSWLSPEDQEKLREFLT